MAEHGTRAGDDGRLRFKHDPLHLTRGPYLFVLAYAEAFWRAVTCPVLLVNAAESEFHYAPDGALRRQACFRDVRTAQIAEAVHMMQRHQPRALAALLLDFLR